MIREAMKNQMVATLSNLFGENLEAIILYGSHAEDRATPYSDVDILIVLRKGFPDWRTKRRAEVAVRKETIALGPISPRIMAGEEISSALEAYNPLVLNALSFGIILFGGGSIEKLKQQFEKTTAGKLSRLPEGYWRVAV